MAINHWPTAVATHSRNHPETVHACQDLALFDYTKLPEHDLLIASPSCVGHTPARGKEQKHHDAERATAWSVVDALEAKRPEQVVVENVPAFLRWELYGVWKMALAALGYDVREHLLDAARWGVPQERTRVIITGRRRGPAVALVEPGVVGAPARDIIDFAAGQWGPARGRAARTMRVIADGRARFGERFLVPYFSSGSGLKARSLDRPIGTITTKDRYGVVDGDRYRMMSIAEYRAGMSFPTDYALEGTREEQLRQLGNAVPPEMARRIILQLAAAAGGGVRGGC
jgi:DNA (cytosine-5)-methyltransferase 1